MNRSFRNHIILPFQFICLLVLLGSCFDHKQKDPKPHGHVPTSAQLKWHQLEYYGFIHFGLNTFKDQEWGYGNASPEIFNPISFDADQIVSTLKSAGMKGLILTCKHHDGFCLWPSAYTNYSVKSSTWNDGNGDVVREISDACRRHGLKFGVYLSPWDRNHSQYGSQAYLEYYRKQLKELLSLYGPVFEVWFDGANGGTGWYGGANEERIIDLSNYYDWENTWKIVRKFQPDAVIFSDVGPDIRWIGNERGIAGDPCWATYIPQTEDGSRPAPGNVKYQLGQQGTAIGGSWMPAECDVSIRPGWFYHNDQDSLVKATDDLLDLYFKSVGRGASLLLNIPPDKRGRINERDSIILMQFRDLRDNIFNTNIAERGLLTASNVRGQSDKFAPINTIDGNPDTYWATSDIIHSSQLILEFDKMVVFNVINLQEYLPLGQRIRSWAVDVRKDKTWLEIAAGESIGSRRLWKGKALTTDGVRFRFIGDDNCIAINELGIYFSNQINNIDSNK